LVTGSYNTLVGRGAGSNITTGAQNTIIGVYNGTTILTGNVVIAVDDGTAGSASGIRAQHNGTNWSMKGGVLKNVTTHTASGNILITTDVAVYIGSASGQTLTMPNSPAVGKTITIKNRYNSGNPGITISFNGIDQLELASSYGTTLVLAAGQKVTFMFDGTYWSQI